MDLETTEIKVLTALAEHEAMISTLATLATQIAHAAGTITSSLSAGGQVLFCGNGGSAADAQHLAAEFVGRFLKERKAYPALALHTNTSAVTAIGNDYGFDEIFARQVAAHGRPGDVLVAISTSGGSPNVLRAVEAAREGGMHSIGFSGGDGGPLAEVCDECLTVPISSTPRIQEGHILIGHVLCGLVEDALCCETL